MDIRHIKIRWQLLVYDIFIAAVVQFVLLVAYKGSIDLTFSGTAIQFALLTVIPVLVRVITNTYGQIWRYGGVQSYVRLLVSELVAFILLVAMEMSLPIEHISFGRIVAIESATLLCAIAIRMFYRYAYQFGNDHTVIGRFWIVMLHVFAGSKIKCDKRHENERIRIAIIGAGRVGANLAEELFNAPTSVYNPICFVDLNKSKVGREIHGIPVLMSNETIGTELRKYEVQEVVFAIPNLSDEDKKEQYEYYLNLGYRIKVYDCPELQSANEKGQIRNFDIEDLLFRKPVTVSNEATNAYYKDKTILVTGGGGSIGSEICRQLAKFAPKQIIILDICENGAYDVQQELRIAYGNELNVSIEICSICNKKGMTRVFEAYHPDIVINAAAHKHVPLMEHNCVEAVENNVFGTVTLIALCEKFECSRFMMVSTDKAVNPTNVMGATKRMCEMIVQSASAHGRVKYSATRFGNVLGSAGSVIPLFKKQIAVGGPITITDKRIIRYFMTIPEAARLVLESGAMAKNGELFVLDMGQPVKILDLAQNMIRLSGANNIEIVETGLRPGEKLYEELLINTEVLDKTSSSLIFIEKDEPLPKEEIESKLALLETACASGDDESVRATLKKVVPTYRSMEEVNANASNSREMMNCREIAAV